MRDYAAAVERGGDTGGYRVLTHRRCDVAELDAQIRSRLKTQGRLGEERRYALRQGDRHSEIRLAAGDRIVCTQNDRRLGVKNGSFGTVLELGAHDMRVRLDDGAGKTIDLAEYRHSEHGHASTVHKAQGATVERAFVLATPGMDAHLSYVALSRHREDAALYAGRADFEDTQERVRRLGRDSEADYVADLAEEGGHPVRRGAEHARIASMMALHHAADGSPVSGQRFRGLDVTLLPGTRADRGGISFSPIVTPPC